MDGWIKISRSISRHWLWADAEWLRWWLDMLLMAAWEDRVVASDGHTFTLHRGQILASVLSLTERWHRSKPTVIRFLQRLEKENMISRRMLFRHTSVITVVNYERYQQASTKPMPLAHEAAAATASPDRQVTDFKRQLQGDQYWCEVMAMRFHLTPGLLQKRLDDFFLDQACRGKLSHADLRDAKQHFNNWLLIQQQIERKNETTGNDGQTAQSRRRGVEATLASAEDYKTAF